MRIIEVINSIPSLLLTILIMMILGNNLFALLVALSVTAWCNTARQVRGMIKQLRETEYVYAAEVLGAKPLRIILKTLCTEYAGYPDSGYGDGNPDVYFYGGRS